jgi:hypothetical protein
MVYVLVCTSLLVASNYLLKSKVINIILLIFLIIPLPIIKILLKAFTRKIFIQLEPAYITVEIINNREGQLQRRLDLKDLKSYCIQFPNDKFNSIRFSLRNGKSFEYSFFKQKQSDEDIDTAQLIDAIQHLITEYNNSTTETSRISLVPGFYATFAGLLCIVGLSVSFAVAMFLFSLQNARSLPVTFLFSFLLIVQLIIKRKRDLDYFKKMVD